MESLFGCTVVLLVNTLFPTGQGQNLSFTVSTKDRTFECIVMTIPRHKTVQWTVLGRCSAKIAKIRAVIEVQTRHLVEADDGIELGVRQGFLQAAIKTPVADMIAPDPTGSKNMQGNTVWALPLPFGGIHMHRMTAPIALFKNTKKVPLEATVGEILIQAKRELHGCSDGLQCYR